MQQVRIKQIQLALGQGIKKDEIETLLGLFSDKKKVLREYVAPKIILVLLNKMNLRNFKQSDRF